MLQIDEIYSYIANELINEPAAYNFRDVLKRKVSNISILPNGGTSISAFCDNFAPRFSNLQRTLVNNYLIIYEYYDIDNSAVITHIFHQTQDYGKVFQK